MTSWPEIRARLRGLFHRDAVADEIREELDFHVRMRAEEYERQGASPDAAAKRATRRVGNLAVLRDRGYDVRGGGVMETIIQDIRYGVRLLWKDRSFSAVAVLTLALGIGMSTALASVLEAAIFNPLPYPHPEQLVHLALQMPGPKGMRLGPSVTDMRVLASASHSTTAIAVSRSISTPPINDAPIPERLDGMEVSEGYFDLYGVTPLIGRSIVAADTREGADPVMLLGYDYWQRAFNGRADVLGQTMRFDQGLATIIGVLPKTFGRTTPIWRPLVATPFVLTRQGIGADTEARIRAGLSFEAAAHEMADVLSRAPGWKPGETVRLDGLLTDQVQSSQATARILAGSVGLILLIACVNVAGLLLARGAIRVSELAVRTAIGADRLRLVRQLLTESVVLAFVGGTAGVLVAWWSLDAIVANLPLTIEADATPVIDGRVLIFSATLSIVTGLIFGLAPAFRLSAAGLSGALAHSSRRAGVPLSRRGGQFLIAAETMLAVVLLAGAGLMLRSFNRLLSVDLGFEPGSFYTLEATPLTLDAASFTTYYRSLVDAVRTMPGIAAVGAIDHPPFGSARVAPLPPPPAATGPYAGTYLGGVIPGYFEALGLTAVSGRFPSDADLASGRHIVVLDEGEAKRLFPDGSAIGRTVEIMKQTDEVIGTIRHLLVGGPKGPYLNAMGQAFTLYDATMDEHPAPLTIVVRPKSGAPIVADQLRDAARHVGPKALVGPVRSGADLLGDRLVTAKRRTVLLTLLGSLGLVLTLVGIVGMTAYAVARRTREIGVRMAFGARANQIVGMMLGDVARPVGLGLIAGIGAALLATKAIASFLFETTPTDTGTLVAVAVTLLVCTGLAAVVPARRAARVDPVSALRAE